MVTESYDPGGLIAGDYPLAHEPVTIASGAALLRGALLGKISAGALRTAVAAEKAGGNTGQGTITMDPTTPVLADAVDGVYTVTCITAATGAGTFRVERPDGTVLGDIAVGATFSDDIKFSIADGDPDFIVGDAFTVTVATASRKYALSAADATDGSQMPVAVLAVDVDATEADVVGPAYFSGEFAADKMTFGAGHTAATATAAFRAVSAPIFIRTRA